MTSFRLGTSFDLRLRNQNIRQFRPDATIPINPLMVSRLQRYRLEVWRIFRDSLGYCKDIQINMELLLLRDLNYFQI